MKRLILPLLAVAVAGGLVAASLTVADDAASVNGTAIAQSTVNGDMAAIAGSTAYQCYLNAQVSLATQGRAQLPPVEGAGQSSPDGHQGTYDSAYVRFWMTRLVDNTLVAQLAADRHVVVTAADLSAARQELAADIDGTFATLSQAGLQPTCAPTPSSTEVLASLPPGFVAERVRSVALGDGLAAAAAGYHLTPPALRAYYAGHRSSFDTLCVQGFTVATQASAKKIRTLIQGGLPFAAAAPTGSLQQGCVTPADAAYGPIAAAVGSLAVGQVSQPVASQTGSYYLFELTKRTPSSLSVTSPVVRQTVVAAGEQRAQALLTSAAHRASVTVDPRYGRWTAASVTRGLLPPLAPPSSSLLAPAANTATGLPTSGPLVVPGATGSGAGTSSSG